VGGRRHNVWVYNDCAPRKHCCFLDVRFKVPTIQESHRQGSGCVGSKHGAATLEFLQARVVFGRRELEERADSGTLGFCRNVNCFVVFSGTVCCERYFCTESRSPLTGTVLSPASYAPFFYSCSVYG
jgi:hypothetical protein